MKWRSCGSRCRECCRTSQEVRGLKYAQSKRIDQGGSRTSQEVRGLKCAGGRERPGAGVSHLARGAWIEIISEPQQSAILIRRTSQEVRGLKYAASLLTLPAPQSHLARGAWIEIVLKFLNCRLSQSRTSQEVRGLKCTTAFAVGMEDVVAPRKRCVD